MAGLVIVEGPDADGVAVLTLNRPEKRNALSTGLRDAMSDTFDALAADESCKVVIVTGAPPAFCAGFDLGEFGELGDVDQMRALEQSSLRWHTTLLQFPQPTIAAVNGPALAGGFDLAVMCDLRVASTQARFAHPEIRFSPDLVYTPLLDLVGGAIARELVWTGRVVDADEALRLHVVAAVLEPGELLAGARQYAGQMAQASREVLRHLKEKAVRRAATVVDGMLDV